MKVCVCEACDESIADSFELRESEKRDDGMKQDDDRKLEGQVN